MPMDWIYALVGGVLIGVSVSIMLIWNGRVTGISGIINGALANVEGDRSWRMAFIGGLVLGGFALSLINPSFFAGALNSPDWTVVVAGLLVGFGTIMGSGCTSGHGVCGISRFSTRSLLATVTFMVAGIVAVYLFRTMGVLS